MQKLLVVVDRLFQFSPKHSIVVLGFLSIVAFAANFSEFVPGFLMPKHKESVVFNESAEIRPIVNIKRNSSDSKTWYCNRISGGGSGDVFCSRRESAVNSNVDMGSSDHTKVVDTVTRDDSLSNANQSSMQTQQTKNMVTQYQDMPAIPINTGKDVDMKINQQQIQFNIKY